MTEFEGGRTPRELVAKLIDGTIKETDGGVDETVALAAHYFSTYCLHGNHGDCRQICKTCSAPCRCRCHRPEEAP